MDTELTDIPFEKKDGWRENIRTMIYALLIALVFRSFAYEPFHIPSGSMKEGLLVGDYLFVSKYTYGYSRYSFPFGLPLFEGRVMQQRKPERGDVVVFRLPRNTRVDYIKRIIGLPGDRIQVRDGIVYLNDEPLPRRSAGNFSDDEDPSHIKSIPVFIETLPEGKEITVLKDRDTGYANNTGVYTVPAGHYFMMGDNRDYSRDSRFLEEVGYVPEENIVGRAQMIFFSTDGSAKLWEPWKWLQSMRFGRFLHSID